MPFLNDEARAQTEAYEHDRRTGAAAYRVAIDSRYGSRTLGSIALATIGSSVWTDPDKKMTAREDPIGGIVLDIVDVGRVDDPETGEIRLKRAFRCYDPLVPWRNAFHTFTEDLINPDGVEATQPGRLVLATRRFALKYAQGKAGSVLTRQEGQLIADAHHLAAVLLGGAL